MSEYSQEKEKSQKPGLTWAFIGGITLEIVLFFIAGLVMWTYAKEFYDVYSQNRKLKEECEKTVVKDCVVVDILAGYSRANNYETITYLTTLKDASNPSIQFKKELKEHPGKVGSVIKAEVEKKYYLLESEDKIGYGVLIIKSLAIISLYFVANGMIFSLMNNSGKTIWIRGVKDNGENLMFKVTIILPVIMLGIWLSYRLFLVDLVYEFWK